LNEVCAQVGKRVLRVQEQLALRLEAHDWPGNFRELRHVLEYAVLASQDGELSARDLPAWFGRPIDLVLKPRAGAMPASLGVTEVELTLDFEDTVARFEKEYLRIALDRYEGGVSRTARKIGMNKTTLLRRIRAHGLSRRVQSGAVGLG
jgi:DNA-binding NtrC family response regulator